MPALNFPDSPAVNDTYSSGTRTWTWDGTTWNLSSNYHTLNAKGQLLTHNGSTNAILAVGANNTILVADSSQTNGIKWSDDLTLGSLVVSENASTDAVRITQTGTGNALVVEDSANPDSTPFLVDGSGNVVVGHSSSLGGGNLQVAGTSANRLSMYRYSDDTSDPQANFMKSRSATIGSHTAVQSGDGLGLLTFRGSDGTNFNIGAQVQTLVDGTVSTGVVPGKIILSTASSAGVMTSRVTVDSGGITTIDGRAIFTSSSTSDAVRITQTGAGNALVVEDSANPDSTPVVIDAEGRLIVGYTTSLGSRVQSIGTGQGAFLAAYFAANNSGSGFDAYKSRNTTIGSHTAVQANDSILRLAGWGSDGTNYQISGSVEVGADTTPSAGIVPGFISFKTTSAAGNLTERLKVDSAGLVSIPGTLTVNSVPITGNDMANPVINSNFAIWQRGTSLTGTTLTADRWQAYRAVAGVTTSRQTTSDTTNLPNIQYCARVQRDSGNAATNSIYLGQVFESRDCRFYAGKTVTISFYARCGANFSATSSILQSYLQTGTGTDQNPMTGNYTGGTNVIVGNHTLTTTWQRFTASGTIGATATEFSVMFTHYPTGTAGAADYFEVTGVQLDVGSVARPYAPAFMSYAQELAACQRHYYRTQAGAAGQQLGAGYNESTTVAAHYIKFPVTMRIAPTALSQSGTATDYNVRHGITNTACSAVPTHDNASVEGATVKLTVASGLTAGQGSFARPATTSAFFAWSADL